MKLAGDRGLLKALQKEHIEALPMQTKRRQKRELVSRYCAMSCDELEKIFRETGRSFNRIEDIESFLLFLPRLKREKQKCVLFGLREGQGS